MGISFHHFNDNKFRFQFFLEKVSKPGRSFIALGEYTEQRIPSWKIRNHYLPTIQHSLAPLLLTQMEVQ